MEVKDLIKELVKELAIGFFTFILTAVALMKAEAVIREVTLVNIAIYLLLVSTVVAVQVLLFGKASQYLKYRKSEFDDRPWFMAIVTLAIIWGVPLIIRWWQSEPQASIALGDWKLFTLQPTPRSFPPDWLVPGTSAALVTFVCFMFLRDASDQLKIKAEGEHQSQDTQRYKAIVELKKQLKAAKELISSHEYEAKNWKSTAEGRQSSLRWMQQESDTARRQVEKLTLAAEQANQVATEQTAARNYAEEQVRRERSEKAQLVSQMQSLREELAQARQSIRAAAPASVVNSPANNTLAQLTERLSPQAAAPVMTAPAPAARTDGLLGRWSGAEGWELLLLRTAGELNWQLKKEGTAQALTDDQQAVLRYLYQQGGVPTAPAGVRDGILQISGVGVSYDNIKKILGRMRDRKLVGYSEGKGYFLATHNPRYNPN